jgi:hypothetical protein
VTDHPNLIVPTARGASIVVGGRTTWVPMRPVELVHMAMRFSAAAVEALDAARRCQASPRGESAETLDKSATATATATAKCADSGSDVAVERPAFPLDPALAAEKNTELMRRFAPGKHIGRRGTDHL